MKILPLFLFIIIASCQNLDSEKQYHKSVIKNNGAVNVDGTILSYEIEGEGIPCLVLPSNKAFYSQKLRKHFKLHFVNTRYTAKIYSPIPTEEYTLNTLFEDIDTLREVMDLEKFAIIGHSIHGILAYEYAKKYPKRVTHIIMIGTPCTWGTKEYEETTIDFWSSAPEDRKAIYEENISKLKGIMSELKPLELIVKSNIAEAPKRWYNAKFDATRYYENMTLNFDLAAHLYGKLLSNYRMSVDATHPGIPIFLALGKSDYVVPHILWNGRYDTLSNFTIEYFDKSGHTPQLEESKLFDQKLIDWIKKNQ